MVSNLLDEYGQPKEVWIRTYNQSREGDLPFDTVLFYPGKGFMVRYAKAATEQGDLIKGCPQDTGAPILAVWSYDEELLFPEANSRTLNFTAEGWAYLSLEEATEMSVEMFYETFKDPDKTICLETPENLWPSP